MDMWDSPKTHLCHFDLNRSTERVNLVAVLGEAAVEVVLGAVAAVAVAASLGRAVVVSVAAVVVLFGNLCIAKLATTVAMFPSSSKAASW